MPYIRLEGNVIVGGGEGEMPEGSVSISQEQYSEMRDHLIGGIAFTYDKSNRSISENLPFVENHRKERALERLKQIEVRKYIDQAVAGKMNALNGLTADELEAKL